MAQGVNRTGDDMLPPAPQGHVLDEADLFREYPERLAEVRKSLLNLEDVHGYPVYLAIYYNVYDGNLKKRAETLHQAWIGDEKRGMVLVYQLDPVVGEVDPVLGVNNPVASYFRGSHLDVDAKTRMGVIPGQDVAAMLARVFIEAQKKGSDSEAYVGAIAFGLEREMNSYFEVEPVKWSDRGNLKLMGVFLGTIAVLTLLGALVWRSFARADARSSKIYCFPDVRVGRRLGAPYGGGWVSEKTFVPASSRR